MGDDNLSNSIFNEVFNEFITELKHTAEVPESLIINLKILKENNDLASKEKILESIKMDDSNEN